jgi:hypothetical protein
MLVLLSAPRNIPKERKSYLHGGGSLGDANIVHIG